MNHTKYLHYLVFISIFFTFSHQTMTVSTSSNESTTTKKTTPLKKEVIEETQKNNMHKDDKKDSHTNKSNQKQKKQNKCPYSSTPLKKLTIEQLEEVYTYTKTHSMDAAFMLHLLERLIALSDNHASVKKYKLQLADTHYNAHHLEKAAAFYEDFAVLYPGSKECEYVLYKAVACMFELSLDPDRDQSNTKKTIGLIKEFLKRAQKKDLIEEAQAMLQKCYQKLYDHEVYVFNFYTKKKNFEAAQLRLDYIAKTFTQTISNLEVKVEILKAQLGLAKNPIKPTRKYIVNKLLG